MQHKTFALLNKGLFRIALESRGIGWYSSDHRKSGELYLTKLLARIDPQIIIDIGANCGQYSQLLLNETRARVIAFEPLIDAFRELEVIAKQNIDRLSVFNFAIGAENSRQKIYFGDPKSQLATISEDVLALPYVGSSIQDSYYVEVKTLDWFTSEGWPLLSFGPEFIDIIKIDTEGYELEVLRGSANVINTIRPEVIILEFNRHHFYRNHTLLVIGNYLTDYQAFRVMPYGGLRKIDVSDPLESIFEYSNIVFVRPETQKTFFEIL